MAEIELVRCTAKGVFWNEIFFNASIILFNYLRNANNLKSLT